LQKDIFPEMIETGKSPEAIVKEKNLVQITDTSAIEGIVDSDS
jgi:aspartyl-tRNA(Asn)/glutamyl-tRNA(Gln) amidotransferase subunit B